MCPCEQSLVCGFQKMKDMTTLVIQDYHQSNISRACAAGIADGYVFRPVNRAGQAQGAGLSEKVVWQLLQPYALAAGVPPHDTTVVALARSCAAQPVVSWSKSSYCWGTLRCRQPSGTWAQSRIWCTHRMTGSS